MKRILFCSVAMLALASCRHPTQVAKPAINETKSSQKFDGKKRQVAGDSSEIELSHISADGRYLGFFESYNGDLSGIDNVSFRVLDLNQDKYVIDQKLSNEGSDGATDQTFLDLKNSLVGINNSKIAKLKLVGIKSNAALYAKLVKEAVLNTKTSPDHFFPNEQSYAQDGEFNVNQAKFKYSVDSVAFANKDKEIRCEYIDASVVHGFSITVNGKKVYEDANYPKSRGCAYNYTINRIIYIVEKPVFFVRYIRESFEGPDNRTLLVSPINK